MNTIYLKNNTTTVVLDSDQNLMVDFPYQNYVQVVSLWEVGSVEAGGKRGCALDSMGKWFRTKLLFYYTYTAKMTKSSDFSSVCTTWRKVILVFSKFPKGLKVKYGT